MSYKRQPFWINLEAFSDFTQNEHTQKILECQLRDVFESGKLQFLIGNKPEMCYQTILIGLWWWLGVASGGVVDEVSEVFISNGIFRTDFF